MITAGCDVGSRTAKAVILNDDKLLAKVVIPARLDPRESAECVMDEALKQAGISRDAVSQIVGTGYGQKEIPFADRVESEISCHAMGAFWNHPDTRMIIDIGGQDSKVIKINEKGQVLQYSYNDKCAAGTGRFLEVMADALAVNLEDMGELGRTCAEELTISNQCVIFAETEVVSLINDDKEVPDILNALFRAMAGRVSSQARSLGIESDVVLTGGVAKNIGVFQALAQSLKVDLKPLTTIDPQINGALGAALMGRDAGF